MNLDIKAIKLYLQNKSIVNIKYNKICELMGNVHPKLIIKYIDKFEQYKNRSKSKGLKFSLKFEEFYSLCTDNCYICGISGRTNEIGIDRLVNSKGYTLLNTKPCCWDCNRLKSNMSGLQFLTYLKRLNPSHVLFQLQKPQNINKEIS